MSPWCRVTALDLSSLQIQAQGAGRLAAVLGPCPSLAHLGLGDNYIGAEVKRRLQAASLPSLTLLL